jgi:hypothetical protein
MLTNTLTMRFFEEEIHLGSPTVLFVGPTFLILLSVLTFLFGFFLSVMYPVFHVTLDILDLFSNVYLLCLSILGYNVDSCCSVFGFLCSVLWIIIWLFIRFLLGIVLFVFFQFASTEYMKASS